MRVSLQPFTCSAGRLLVSFSLLLCVQEESLGNELHVDRLLRNCPRAKHGSAATRPSTAFWCWQKLDGVKLDDLRFGVGSGTGIE